MTTNADDGAAMLAGLAAEYQRELDARAAEKAAAPAPSRLLPVRILRRARRQLSGVRMVNGVPVRTPASARRALRREARNPNRLSGAVLHKMAHDRSPMLPLFADKVGVRDHLTALGRGDLLTTAYAVASTPEDIDWGSLPREFAAKVAHASGGVIVVADDADPDARLPAKPHSVGWNRYRVRPEHAHPEVMAAMFTRWLSMDYTYRPGKRPEWAYGEIPRRMIVEELLVPPGRGIPNEVKLFTIHGRVRVIRAIGHSGLTLREKTMAHFDPDWGVLPIVVQTAGLVFPPPGVLPERPKTFDEMVAFANDVARGTDLLRVDLYDLGDRFMFGELTNYPSAGEVRFWPSSWDEHFGAIWKEGRT